MTRRTVGAAGLVLLPLVVVAASPWRPAAALVLLGMMPALAVSPISAVSATRAIAPMAAVGFAATALTASGPLVPVAGTGLVMVLAMLTARAASSDLASARSVLIIVAAHLLVDPAGLLPDVASVPVAVAAAVVSAVLAGSAGWIAAVIALVLPERRSPIVGSAPGVAYGVVLTAVCGSLALVCLLWFRGTQSWWMVLTAALVVQRNATGTMSRAAHRVGGTLLGAALSLVAAVVAPSAALVWIGVVAACACALASVGGAPYWVFTTAVTTAVLTLTSSSSGMLTTDLERLICTVAAAGASVAAWALWRLTVNRRWPARSARARSRRRTPRRRSTAAG